MAGEPDKPSGSWNLRLEEKYFAEFVERFGRELSADPRFPYVAQGYPQRLADLVKQLPAGFRTEFLVNLISAANCLCLRTWRDYVQSHWKQIAPDLLHEQLGNLPNLSQYLTALGLGASVVRRFPTLASEDLVARSTYADGGRCEDYEAAFGCTITPPDYRLLIAPQTDTLIFDDLGGKGTAELEYITSTYFEDNDSLRRTLRRFPLIQKVSVGRQKSREPAPFDMVFGSNVHRLIIAEKKEVNDASRDQMLVSVLTPQFLYVRNTSDHYQIECFNMMGSKKLRRDESCLTQSDVTIKCNKIRLEVFQLDTDRRI